MKLSHQTPVSQLLICTHLTLSCLLTLCFAQKQRNTIFLFLPERIIRFLDIYTLKAYKIFIFPLSHCNNTTHSTLDNNL